MSPHRNNSSHTSTQPLIQSRPKRLLSWTKTSWPSRKGSHQVGRVLAIRLISNAALQLWYQAVLPSARLVKMSQSILQAMITSILTQSITMDYQPLCKCHTCFGHTVLAKTQESQWRSKNLKDCQASARAVSLTTIRKTRTHSRNTYLMLWEYAKTQQLQL